MENAKADEVVGRIAGQYARLAGRIHFWDILRNVAAGPDCESV